MTKPRTLATAAAALVVLAGFVAAGGEAGAPRRGGRFVNPGSVQHGASPAVTLPFFLRKAWTSVAPRSGAAPRVPFDRAVLESSGPTVTWIGHATMLVRLDGTTFLTDPMFSRWATPVPGLGPGRLVEPGATLAEIGRVDFATLSHNHYDHTDLDSIRALAAAGTRFVVPLGLGELVRSAGGEAIELDWWQSTRIGSVDVHCVPAQHFSRRGLFDGDATLWAGWVVAGASRRFYHAGDTGYFGGFREIASRLGPIDLAAIPIGAYEPSAMMRPVHVNPEEAVQAAIDVAAARVIPMHYGTFDLADEPLDEPPKRFAAEATRQGLGSDRAWILKVGESRRW